ncbi:MAG TPA: hypothetical protein VHE30_26990 [Polyangiaceae bacterium]|nr:hypothetical protein [Polyangiaceae bacterium]
MRAGGGLRGWSREQALDAGLLAIAAVIVVPTLDYRYGIDQALYHYVGAGLRHGELPYRDAFDVKSPGIFIIYGFSQFVLGDHQWAIRVFEAWLLLGTGWAVGSAARAREPAPGLRGACALLCTAFYVFSFGFWDTAQAELWEGACVALAAVALVGPGERRSAALGGLLAGLACLFKVTAALPALVLLATQALVLRPRLAFRAERALVFTLGAAAPVAAVVLWFALARATRFLSEWFFYLPHYAGAPLDRDWVHWTGPEFMLARTGSWLGAFAVPIAFGVAAKPRRSLAALAVLAATILTIVVQRRWFSYHSAVLGPVLVLAGAHGLREAFSRAPAASATALLGVVAGQFFTAPEWTGSPAMNFRTFALHTWLGRARGLLSEKQYDLAFAGPFEYGYAAQTALADLILARHPAPRDGLHVRGFDTTVYVLTGLRSPSRFMMESPLQDARLASYRPEWQLEHDRALTGPRKPRFAVTQVGYVADIRWWTANGYGLAGSRDRYVLLERGLSATPLEAEAVKGLLEGRTLLGTVMGDLPVALRFGPGTRLTAESGDSALSGTFEVHEDGEVCVSGEAIANTCVAVYRRQDRLVAFSADGREIANLAVGGG